MSEGFTCEQHGDITVFTFADSSEGAIDSWAAALAETINSTPPNRLFLILMDVSSRQVSFTGYARQRSKELFSRYRVRKGRLAFLFSSRTAPHYARLFFASLGQLTFALQFFSSREKALAWLQAGAEKPPVD
jgi:hypothetical protein